MSVEQDGGASGQWLDNAREALAKKAEEQGQEWMSTAQGHAQDAYGQAHGAAAHAGEAVSQWAHDATHAAASQPADGHDQPLDLGERDRLPWLESGEDDDEYYVVDTKRVVIAVLGGLALMAALVGGLWAWTHRKAEGAPVADGSMVGAPAQPYKQAPAAPGGKQFEGTGDSSFAAAQGKDHGAQLAEGGAKDGADAGASFAKQPAPAPAAEKAAPAAKPSAAPAAPAAANEAGPVGGVVQIAAYSSEATARANWDRLVQQHDMLKGLNHRIVQGQADIGVVYRLQLITGAGGGNALCAKLKADGLACQVKH